MKTPALWSLVSGLALVPALSALAQDVPLSRRIPDWTPHSRSNETINPGRFFDVQLPGEAIQAGLLRVKTISSKASGRPILTCTSNSVGFGRSAVSCSTASDVSQADLKQLFDELIAYTPGRICTPACPSQAIDAQPIEAGGATLGSYKPFDLFTLVKTASPEHYVLVTRAEGWKEKLKITQETLDRLMGAADEIPLFHTFFFANSEQVNGGHLLTYSRSIEDEKAEALYHLMTAPAVPQAMMPGSTPVEWLSKTRGMLRCDMRVYQESAPDYTCYLIIPVEQVR